MSDRTPDLRIKKKRIAYYLSNPTLISAKNSQAIYHASPAVFLELAFLPPVFCPRRSGACTPVTTPWKLPPLWPCCCSLPPEISTARLGIAVQEQVATYRENNHWHREGDSHQHSQADNQEENVSPHDRGVGVQQFRLDLSCGDTEQKRLSVWLSLGIEEESERTVKSAIISYSQNDYKLRLMRLIWNYD